MARVWKELDLGLVGDHGMVGFLVWMSFFIIMV